MSNRRSTAPSMVDMPAGRLRRAEGIEAITFLSGVVWHAVDPFTELTLCGREAFDANQMYEEWSDVDEQDKCRVCLRVDHRNEAALLRVTG